jgi:hypothetical protein
MYRIVDTVILVLCLPVYLVISPVVALQQWLAERRKVYIGLEVSHRPGHHIREDYLVVDVSRLSEGLVGIRRRQCAAYCKSPPAYSEEVEFIPVARFWVPNPVFWGNGRA